MKSLFAQTSVNVNHVQAANRPTKEGHIQQFFFEDICQVPGHDDGHQKCFISGLVFDQQDGWFVLAWEMMFAFNHITDTQYFLSAHHGEPQPKNGNTVEKMTTRTP